MHVILDRWPIDHAESAFLSRDPAVIAGSDIPVEKVIAMPDI